MATKSGVVTGLNKVLLDESGYCITISTKGFSFGDRVDIWIDKVGKKHSIHKEKIYSPNEEILETGEEGRLRAMSQPEGGGDQWDPLLYINDLY